MNSYENPSLSYECDLTAERGRLREINKELLEALELCVPLIEAMQRQLNANFDDEELADARAAIAHAKGEV